MKGRIILAIRIIALAAVIWIASESSPLEQVAFLFPTCVCCSTTIPDSQCNEGECITHPISLTQLLCTMTTDIGCSFTDQIMVGPAGGTLGSSITGCTILGWAFGGASVQMGCCNPSGGGLDSMKVILVHDCGGGVTITMGSPDFTITLHSCNPLHVTAVGFDVETGANVNLDFHE